MRTSRIPLLIAGLAIVTGGLIYILFRPSEFVFFQWIRTLGFGQTLTFLRAPFSAATSIMPNWFIYSVPDSLWAFAYTLIILTLWSGSKSVWRYLWYATIPILLLGSELLQLTGTIRGTFSFSDVGWITAGLFVGILTYAKTTNHLYYENTNNSQDNH